ncbi:hypothetical protein EB796_004697 [Bugula neritina]|uniref:Hexosyltransferase n=1 Tax=Bugula neritina TaxID=10212 RepID=A0A7J7KH66_BUGNE|nr:hypothetical protein EB796_004697 [Bugula neritina]
MTKNRALQNIIRYESETYGDIVQESFLDSYRNLTYKAIEGAKWTSTYCKSAKLILKTDDDIVVDVHLLFHHIERLRAANRAINNTIICKVVSNVLVNHNSSKWKVTVNEYNKTIYPPFCPGYAFVMTADIVPKLYQASFYEKFFWIDDIYLTGLLAQTIKVKHETLKSTVFIKSEKKVKKKKIWQNNCRWIFYRFGYRHTSVDIWYMIKLQKAKLFRKKEPFSVCFNK